MTDPFFLAKQKLPFGQRQGYVEDVFRTYGKPQQLPKRDPAAFERALQFREREKEEWKRDRVERDDYAARLAESEAMVRKLTSSLTQLTEQFSRQREKHERSIADSDSTRSVRAVRDEQGIHSKGVGKDRTEARTDDGSMQREVVPSELPDTRGQAGQHSTEGRHTRGVVDTGNVRVREAAVHHGSEGASGSESSGTHSDVKLADTGVDA